MSYHHCQCPSVWRFYLSFSQVLIHPPASSSLTTPSCKLPKRRDDRLLLTWILIFLFICVKLLEHQRWKITVLTWHICYMYCLSDDGALASKAHPAAALILSYSELWRCMVIMHLFQPSKTLNIKHFRSSKREKMRERCFAEEQKACYENANKNTDATLSTEVFFHIHLYPQTQRTEPILIWPCRLLSSPYWKSKYSNSDKKTWKGSLHPWCENEWIQTCKWTLSLKTIITQ